MDVILDVPDSTDWLGTTLSDFSTLENVLHCEICKEFYDTPMITSCSHTFCSKCIRTSLSSDGRCPACRATDQANKLRNNYAVQEIVRLFVQARPQAITVARQRRDEEEQAKKRPGKRKRNVPDSDEMEAEVVEGPTTRRKSRRIAASQTSEPEAMVIGDSDDDQDYEDETEVSDGLVECLLGCGKRMKVEEMDSHLDRCEAEQKAAKQAKSRTQFGSAAAARLQAVRNASTPKERLAELNYSMMNQNALSKKLRDLGIPSQGAKPLMVRRHVEWVNIWNANCDSNNPRTKAELLRDLDTWERTQGGRAPNASTFTHTFKQKDFDGNAWAARNKDDFSRLIADAKRKKSNPTTEQQNVSKMDEKAEPLAPDAPEQDVSSSTARLETAPASYANNPEAIASVRQKVEAANAGREIEPVMNAGFRIAQPEPTKVIPSILSERSMSLPVACSPVRGSQNSALLERSMSASQRGPLGQEDEHIRHARTGSTCSLATHLLDDGTPRKVPMFAVPEKPVSDVDDGGQLAS